MLIIAVITLCVSLFRKRK
ncbi:MAG: hypothetical protein FWH57_06970 [Oscillospiraceae bacterium]|nr:hypothetical protein [Oscillospiraceae bacterium]